MDEENDESVAKGSVQQVSLAENICGLLQICFAHLSSNPCQGCKLFLKYLVELRKIQHLNKYSFMFL